MSTTANTKELQDLALRVRELREIAGYTEEEMAEKTEVSLEDYRSYEAAEKDIPFTFIHKCALAFGVDMSDLIEGHSAKLSSYTVTRKGQGVETAKEDGIEIQNLAPLFRKKIAEPYYVNYEYRSDLQDKPIHLTKHSGQEFDFVIKGKLKVQVGDNIEILGEGDSIYYNSSTPHGMIAVEGEDCFFLAVVLPGADQKETEIRNTLIPSKLSKKKLICSKFIETEVNDKGALEKISFKNEDKFNFAFDIVDEIAKADPEKLAMIHLDKDKVERRFTFQDMKRSSAQCANYFKALGVGEGDKVMVVLKRH